MHHCSAYGMVSLKHDRTVKMVRIPVLFVSPVGKSLVLKQSLLIQPIHCFSTIHNTGTVPILGLCEQVPTSCFWLVFRLKKLNKRNFDDICLVFLTWFLLWNHVNGKSRSKSKTRYRMCPDTKVFSSRLWHTEGAGRLHFTSGKTSLNWGNMMYLTWQNSHLLQIQADRCRKPSICHVIKPH